MEKKTCCIVIVLCILPLFAGCSDSGKKGKGGSKNDVVAKKQIKRFTLVETKGIQKKWVLDAESARLTDTEKGEVLEITDFNINFYKENKVQVFMKAPLGYYYRDTQRLETSGKVFIETENRKITTRDVEWDPQRELFITDEEVLIETEGGELRGKGMEASMDLKEIKIKEKIRGKYIQ
jgi:LPS export ABC transporter protein LptC